MGETTDDIVPEVSSPVLRKAAQRVGRRVAHHPGTAGRPDGARTTLEALLAALAGDSDLRDALSDTDPVTSLHLLEHLRSEVVGLWARSRSRVDPEEMLRTLRAFERVRAGLLALLPDPAASPYALPSTPELVVELAHDFRSPLTSILFLAETLRRAQSGPVNELQYQQLGIVYSAALSLVSLAGDVIELARGGSQLMDRHPSPLSISQMLEAVRDLVLPMAEERGIVLRTFSPPRDRYFGHSVPLSRVLLNLTTNALQATEHGFVEIVVREVSEARIEFSVRDSGPGIDEELQPHLFEPFRTKGGHARLGFSGTGLGLTICRRLVTAMGGELRFETTPGWGTRFFFELDLPPAAPVELEPRS